MPKRIGRLRDPDMMRIRAIKMVEFRIANHATNREVAEEFKVSEDTVERAFSFAKRAKLLTKIEDKVLSELLPAAHRAILDGLSSDNSIEAARIGLEIFKGVVPGFKKSNSNERLSESRDELSKYIAELREQGAIDEQAIDGELTGPTVLALPAAEAVPPPSGDVVSPGGIPDGPSHRPQVPQSLGDIIYEGSLEASEG